MPNQLITNLVFQGGSVKGIAYTGGLEHVDMKTIKRVAGTSAGAITSCLLAIGCTLQELKALSDEFDFKEVLDDSAGGVNTRAKVLKTVDNFANNKNTLIAIKPVKTVKKVLAHRVYTQSGIYEGEYLRKWIEEKIQEQVKKLTKGAHTGEYLTFAELHQLILDYPDAGFRDLKIVGSNFTKAEKKVFSHDDPETKNMIISDAVRISMSIPVLFKPHYMHQKIDGMRNKISNDVWEDGGVYDNYPIDCFDDEKYMDEGEHLLQAENGTFYNPQTLGFRLVSAEHKQYCEALREKKIAEKPKKSSDSFINTIAGLLDARTALQEEKYSRIEHINRTVYIDHLNVSIFAFNLSEQKKKALIQSGEEATRSYLNEYNLSVAPQCA